MRYKLILTKKSFDKLNKFRVPKSPPPPFPTRIGRLPSRIPTPATPPHNQPFILPSSLSFPFSFFLIVSSSFYCPPLLCRRRTQGTPATSQALKYEVGDGKFEGVANHPQVQYQKSNVKEIKFFKPNDVS
ncbi:hypothetical protein C1H46_020762 [Malus baccata]|uniref:Uncharacterized protein n=1 Tax=Malus baccata TaxID=106549 RepID=A0A540M4D3_MALBA|nr:hypothetical protein C1H46_020762 [Malus baccata]